MTNAQEQQGLHTADNRLVRRIGDAVKLAGVLVTAVLSRRPVRPLGDEAGRQLTGDELVPSAGLRWTHGITIRALIVYELNLRYHRWQEICGYSVRD